ncbi:MAG: UbiA family prenyltransferase [Nocardioides sp.]
MLLRRRARRKQEARAAAVASTGSQPGPVASAAQPEPESVQPEPEPAVQASEAAAPEPEPSAPAPEAPTRSRHGWREAGPLLVLRSAHPRQAFLTAAAVAAAAALAGRPTRELGLVFVTVLVGQTIVGWHNDLRDRARDAANETRRKPVAEGLLDPGTLWFLIACAALLLVPLAIANGVVAGVTYLVIVVVSLLGNLMLRKGWLSWLPWAVSYGLYPAFLSYGGWGGTAEGSPPEISITALAALLGVCVHFLRALPGLVADNRDGYRHLPLRVALRTGAPRLLWIMIVLTVLVVAALLVTGSRVGLAQ